MKKSNLYILCISMLTLVINGCSKLETEPTDRIISKAYWKTEEDAIKAVNGIYSTIRASDYIYYDAASDIAYNQITSQRAHLLGNGSQNAELMTWSENKWRSSYGTIQRVNTLLENIDRIENIDENLKSRLIAEAKFIRSMTYSDMSFLWGDVPLVTTTLDIKTGNVSRTPKDEVVDFVIEELKSIQSDLPEKYDNDNTGRVTKGAAKAMLMRTYLRANRYEEAKVVAKEIMDMGIYKLYPNYEDLFKYAGQNSGEIIFDKQYIPTTYNNGLSNWLSPRSSFGGSYIVPLKDLVDSYEMINGSNINDPESGYDPYHPYINRDPRLESTVWTSGDTLYTGEVFKPYPNQDPVGTDAVDNGSQYTSPTGFNFNKYVNPEDLKQNNSNSSNNIILIRYAEVLLSYAEAKVETNDIDASVYQAINDVRQRVGMPSIAQGRSQGELRNIVRHERKVEFPLEGLRYFDVRRWGIAEKVIPGQTYGFTYLNESGKLDTIKAEYRKFNPARDHLWPIPQRELNVNPNLTQNPEY